MNNWFGLLKEQIEANGGNPIAPERYARIKVTDPYQTCVQLLQYMTVMKCLKGGDRFG